ncbi:hypothetical protein SPRG_10732 [Saprolegnia parasitica CBS 223.65]|uniref:Myb-like domain-containing protein n=1 Tax=Saprolegnia parasitica (strain CBS 223.65) TaxID=695850 RepID=A0A067C324_SAPPC|nr:hypothetical protein SPRG_10732 [Saprolegnia parasitica CBS 223.65]KDO23540.1 hypothetical protein SPRG_10732 [Saprolegnia parasitica CBS 223.65]|eukprot:XP_012205690.1 hypothetical protein SPRG_10732 [Saprolegnia parasitica CBS 223.65]
MSKPQTETTTNKTKWTKDQLALLKRVNPKRTTWKKTQLDFPDHSAEDCRQKWHSEFTSTKKGAWTPEEDEKLIHARTLTTKWTTVAEIVETRSYRQCQTRWKRMPKQALATARNSPPRYQPVEELETTTELPPTDGALDFRFLDLDLGSGDLPGTALHTPCGAPPQTTETEHVEPAWHAFVQKAPRCHPVEELETTTELPPTDGALDFRFLDLDLGSGDLSGMLHTLCGPPPQTTETEHVEPAWYAFLPAPTLDTFASAPSNMDSMDRITQRPPATMAVVEAEEDATSPETAAEELNSLLDYMQANMWLDVDEPMPLLYA